MKAVLFTLLFVGISSNEVPDECQLASFYKELGCMPVASSVDSKCPNAYTCPGLHPDPKKCYYRGKAYENGDMIPQNLIKNSCSINCACSISPSPSFTCAAVDCVETFNNDMRECINTYYDLNSCCSTNTICGKDAIAKLKTCEYEGQTYKEGQLIYPKNNLKKCLCTAQFNGSVDHPDYCRSINCGIEIHMQDALLNNCAAIFTKDGGCPFMFTCPFEKSMVIRGINLKSVNEKCVFGNMTLSVGDEVTVDEKCTKCTCNVPPFVDCIKLSVCNE